MKKYFLTQNDFKPYGNTYKVGTIDNDNYLADVLTFDIDTNHIAVSSGKYVLTSAEVDDIQYIDADEYQRIIADLNKKALKGVESVFNTLNTF